MAWYCSCSHRVPLHFKVLEPAAGDLFRVVEVRDFSRYLPWQDGGLRAYYVRCLDVVGKAGESQPASHFLLAAGSRGRLGLPELGPPEFAIPEQGPHVPGPRSQEVAVAIADSSLANQLAEGQPRKSTTHTDVAVRNLGRLPCTSSASLLVCS